MSSGPPPAGTPAPVSTADTVRRLLQVVVGGWLTILLTTLAGGAGALVVLHERTPQYRSSITLIVSVPPTGTTVAHQQVDRSTAVTRAFGLAQIATTPPAVVAAVAAAGLPPGPAAVGASATLLDPFLRVDVVDPDPARAHAVAAAYADSLLPTADRLEGGGSPPVRVRALAPASEPTSPVTPGPLRVLVPGLVAGLLLGVVVRLLKGLTATGVTDADDLARLTGWPVVGRVPSGRRGGTRPDPAVVEAHRQIRTAVLLGADGPPPRTVVLVGVTPGAGTVRMAVDLGRVLAAQGRRVALVDPHPDDRAVAAQLAAGPAVTGVLDLAEPGGSGADGDADPAWWSALTTRYDHVLVAVAPVVPRAPDLPWVLRADGVLVVAALGGTPRTQVRATAGVLRRAAVTVLGVVATSADPDDVPYRPDTTAGVDVPLPVLQEATPAGGHGSDGSTSAP